ncbi:hypothetical protein D3C75_1090880 [compost metagenome]
MVLVPSQEIGQRSREASFRKYGYRKVRISAANRSEGKRRFTEVRLDAGLCGSAGFSTLPGLVPDHKGWCRARGLRLARKQAKRWSREGSRKRGKER